MLGRRVGVLAVTLVIAGCTSAPGTGTSSTSGASARGTSSATTESSTGTTAGSDSSTADRRSSSATSPSTGSRSTSASSTSTSPSSTSSPAMDAASDLTRDLAAVRAAHPDIEVSVAVAPVGPGADPRVVGAAPPLVAWSTIKVPLALAVQEAGLGEEAAADVDAAITVSDNDAAARLWDRLGGGQAAAAATRAQLERGGDHSTTVPPEVTVEGFSPFGQAVWRLEDQATFTASLPCLAGSAAVTDAMGRVVPGQSWGLGTIEGARFKGGWGPTPDGYVLRQLGILPGTKGETAVALQVRGGDHEQATAIADEVAEVLDRHEDDLPTGSCS